MSLNSRIFAAVYDRMSARFEKAGGTEMRSRLLARASGRVLEIGAGTGSNLAHYPEGVEELVVTEPESPMLRRLERKVSAARPATRVVQTEGESLPFDDGSFDTVVSTLVLCTVRDPAATLAEIRRVLAPGGRFLFLEHVRSDEPKLARWQDRLNPVWHAVAMRCNCNRPTLETIEAAGFAVGDVARGELPKSPRLVRPYVLASATR